LVKKYLVKSCPYSFENYFTPINVPKAPMTVKKLLYILKQLDDEGLGDYGFTIIYDSGFGACGIGEFQKVNYKFKCIEFDEEY
jgi:hypothetical protein